MNSTPTAMNATARPPVAADTPAAAAPAAQPAPAPADGIHGEQPDSPPPGGGAWAWVPGTGWVPREA